jgi:hypothetical protein
MITPSLPSMSLLRYFSKINFIIRLFFKFTMSISRFVNIKVKGRKTIIDSANGRNYRNRIKI